MGLRIENFNILGVHWKIRLLGGGVHEKLIQRGGIASKGGAWTVYKFKWVTWQERGRWCFWGEGGSDTPMKTMLI